MGKKPEAMAHTIVQVLTPGHWYGIDELVDLTGASETRVRLAIAQCLKERRVVKAFAGSVKLTFRYRLADSTDHVASSAPSRVHTPIAGYDAALRSFRDICMAARPAPPVGQIVRYNVHD